MFVPDPLKGGSRRLLAAAKMVGGDLRAPRNHDQTKNALDDGCGRPRTSVPTSEWYKLILIGIYTGLRLGDCCRLDWSSINLAQGVIQVVPRKTRRHHQRMVTIPIHPALGAALLGTQSADAERDKRPFYDPAYDGLRPTPESQNGQLAFESPDELNAIASREATCVLKTTGPVLPTIAEMYARSRWRVSHELSRIFKAANITMSVKLEGRHRKTPEATFHSLRHTFVSFAANAGVPLHIVQSIVGHESTAMTRHYYHENIDALKSAVAAIPSL